MGLTAEHESLLRAYADPASGMSWATLREKGIDNYLYVLAGLGELGLRPPMAPMTGPNVDSRTRGRALIRRLLAERFPR
jgi:hypothetical protein